MHANQRPPVQSCHPQLLVPSGERTRVRGELNTFPPLSGLVWLPPAHHPLRPAHRPWTMANICLHIGTSVGDRPNRQRRVSRAGPARLNRSTGLENRTSRCRSSPRLLCARLLLQKRRYGRVDVFAAGVGSTWVTQVRAEQSSPDLTKVTWINVPDHAHAISAASNATPAQ